MKVRNGFVSNSSSSSFLIDKIPNELRIKIDSFVGDDDSLGELCDTVDDGDEETLDNFDKGIIPNEMVGRMNALVDRLRSGRQIYREDDYDMFWPVYYFLKRNGMVMMTLDGPGGDGEDMLVPFKDERKKQ